MVSKRLLACLIPALLLVATGAKKFESKALDREVEIDGEMNEWQGVMTMIGKTGLAIGIFNDNDYLYVCLRSSDRDVNHVAVRLLAELCLAEDHEALHGVE